MTIFAQRCQQASGTASLNAGSATPLPDLGETYSAPLARGITLVACPGKEISWEHFLRLAPPRSIALDGLVRGAPRFSLDTLHANFNHHQDVDRLATRSTCGQVLVALKQGLLDGYQEGGYPRFNIYVNDPDQDSSLAVWLLANHERITGTKSEPLLNKLIYAEDMLDTTAGAYPLDPKSSLMTELAWVFEPYVEARMAGRIQAMKGPELANVIGAVGNRISRYSLGQGEAIALDTRFDDIGGGTSWRMIKEVGFYARTGLFSKGIKAFVSFLREQDGAYHYSIGRMSAFVPFPVADLYMALNEREGLDPNSGVAWNGGDTIGGSPRRVGSRLSPSEVEAVINMLLERRGRILCTTPT